MVPSNLEPARLPPVITAEVIDGAHDFDLPFQLRYLKKLGKLGTVTVIGIPQEGEVDHLLIKSIFRKLVAQDMQGS